MSTVIEKLKQGGMVKGNKKLRFPGIKQMSHGDVLHSMGNIVNNKYCDSVLRCQMVIPLKHGVDIFK